MGDTPRVPVEMSDYRLGDVRSPRLGDGEQLRLHVTGHYLLLGVDGSCHSEHETQELEEIRPADQAILGFPRAG